MLELVPLVLLVAASRGSPLLGLVVIQTRPTQIGSLDAPANEGRPEETRAHYRVTFYPGGVSLPGLLLALFVVGVKSVALA